jgi:hypothetical protein
MPDGRVRCSGNVDKAVGTSAKGALVAATTLALAFAVLLPDELPDHVRDWMGLGSGDKTAATPWLRGFFVAIALLLLLIGRRFEQVAWPDVFVLLVATLIVAATVNAFHHAQKATKVVVAPTARFTFTTDKLVRAPSLASGDKIALLAVKPDKSDNGTVLSYVTTRYDVFFCSRASGVVKVAVARGDNDATAEAFVADLAAASEVYLLAGGKPAADGQADAGNTAGNGSDPCTGN